MQLRFPLALVLALALSGFAGELRAKSGGSGPAATSCPPCQSLVDALNAKHGRLETVEAQLESDRARAEALTQQRRPLQGALNEFEERKKQLNEELTEAQQELLAAQHQRDQLSWLQALAQGVTRRLRAAEQTVLGLQNAVGLLQPRIDELREQIQEIDDSRERVRELIDREESEAERLKAEIPGLERALAACEKQCGGGSSGGGGGGITVGGGQTGGEGGSSEDGEGGEGEASTSCIPCTALTTAINAAIDELRAARKAKQEAEKELQKIYAEMEAPEGARSEALQEVSQLKWDLGAAQGDVEQVGRDTYHRGPRYAAAQARLAEVQAAMAAAQARYDAADQQIDEIWDRARKPQKAVWDAAARIKAKQAEIDGLWRTLSECESQCKVSITPNQSGRADSGGDPLDPDNRQRANDAADVFRSGGKSKGYQVLPPGLWVPGSETAPGVVPNVGDALDALRDKQSVQPDPKLRKDDSHTNPCSGP